MAHFSAHQTGNVTGITVVGGGLVCQQLWATQLLVSEIESDFCDYIRGTNLISHLRKPEGYSLTSHKPP